MVFQVGDAVYQPFSPAKHGIVTRVDHPPDILTKCGATKPLGDGIAVGRVLAQPVCELDSGHTGDHVGVSHVSTTPETWPNPTPGPKRYHTPMPVYTVTQPNGKTFSTKTLNSYVELVADHQRKLAKHQAVLAVLMQMAATSTP